MRVVTILLLMLALVSAHAHAEAAARSSDEVPVDAAPRVAEPGVAPKEPQQEPAIQEPVEPTRVEKEAPAVELHLAAETVERMIEESLREFLTVEQMQTQLDTSLTKLRSQLRDMELLQNRLDKALQDQLERQSEVEQTLEDHKADFRQVFDLLKQGTAHPNGDMHPLLRSMYDAVQAAFITLGTLLNKAVNAAAPFVSTLSEKLSQLLHHVSPALSKVGAYCVHVLYLAQQWVVTTGFPAVRAFFIATWSELKRVDEHIATARATTAPMILRLRSALQHTRLGSKIDMARVITFETVGITMLLSMVTTLALLLHFCCFRRARRSIKK